MGEDDDYRERFFRMQKEDSPRVLKYFENEVEVITPFGPAQTIANDKKLHERYWATKQKNEEYYLFKKSQNFLVMGSWDIDVRRENEWLL